MKARFIQGQDAYKALDIGNNRSVKKSCIELNDYAYDYAYNYLANSNIEFDDVNIDNLKRDLTDSVISEDYNTICDTYNKTIRSAVEDAVDTYKEDKEVEDYKTEQRISTW